MRYHLSATCLLLVSILVVTGAAAKDWAVTRQDGRYFATIPEFGERKFELKSFGGVEPQPGDSSKAPPKSHPHIRVFSYFAGRTGSPRVVSHYHALVVNAKTGELLGDVPSSYIVSTTPRTAQPRWTWKADQLLVKDAEFDRELRISLR